LGKAESTPTNNDLIRDIDAYQILADLQRADISFTRLVVEISAVAAFTSLLSMKD